MDWDNIKNMLVVHGFGLSIIPKMRFYAEIIGFSGYMSENRSGIDRADNEEIGENGCLKPKNREISGLG